MAVPSRWAISLTCAAIFLLALSTSGSLPGANALPLYPRPGAEPTHPLLTAACPSPLPKTQAEWLLKGVVWPATTLTLGGQFYNQKALVKLLKLKLKLNSKTGAIKSDARQVLLARLAAAQLNVTAGVDPAPVAIPIQAASSQLAGAPPKVSPTSSLGTSMLATALVLDRYNNGLLPLCVSTPTPTRTSTPTATATATATPTSTTGAVPPPGPIRIVGVSPDALFVNEPRSITVRAAVPYSPNGGSIAAALQRVDANGNPTADEGSLTDDGDLSNADEIGGDGVFSLKKSFSSSAEGRIQLRVRVQQGGHTVTSEIFKLEVITHLTSEQLAQILSIQTSASQDFESKLATMSRTQARDAVLTQLQQNSEVDQAGLSGDGHSIWIVYKSGVPGGLDLTPPGFKGGGLPAGGSTQAAMLPSTIAAAADTDCEAESASPGGTRLASLLWPASQPGRRSPTAATDRIKNRKVIVLSPFNFEAEYPDQEEGISLGELFKKSTCPKFDVTVLKDQQVTVDVVKTLHQYGVVIISSHGDTYYDGLGSFFLGKWGWNNAEAQVVFYTGEQVTDADRAAREEDLKQGRLAINTRKNGKNNYAVLPSFISHYAAGKYPNSLVYLSACRSVFNNSMANAFIGAGVQTILGYSDYVEVSFAFIKSQLLFDKFLKDPNVHNIGEAFTAGQKDPTAPHAEFVLRGSDKAEKPSSDLENGGFEDGALGAWNVTGDGRVITQLGPYKPVGGSHMGVISTGLGFTTAAGQLDQKICLPTSAEWLEFNWNFSSEEFKEWVGSGFQDSFRVEIIPEGGTAQTVFLKTIDSLAGSATATSLAFDKSGPGCVVGQQNDCKVWSTGWQKAVVDVKSIAAANEGKPVTLRFSAVDVGDSSFDTAVLLDEVTIVTP